MLELLEDERDFKSLD